ncbi:ABC transporter substrate-binding protein [Pseudonocardia nigra]|uniref:ABC transporter substrate-binding protein n=1 Tax=Pseudonocardia nigra TaxID=1921578 RepID=UPI001C5D50CF|nr:extracellular solute-binding protein [Pseudonocardia nigra]
MRKPTPRRTRMLIALATAAVVATGCSAGSLGSSGGDGEGVALSFLTGNNPDDVALAEGLAEAYMAENPDVNVEVQTRPGGTEGDNLVKTRLATGDMANVFVYNSGSLLQALNPTQTLVPVTDQPWVADLDQTFVDAVSANGEVFGAPVGTVQAGAVMYNKAVYEQLGLEVPRTWDEFMANNAVIAERTDAAPVIQTYQETWTSQLFVLGDFHNVLQAEPNFPERYTAGELKYATSEAALRGFQHQQAVHEAGYMNEDFASATYEEGLRMLAQGEGVHYPILTSALAEIVASYPDAVDDIGVFGLPGPDPATHGITVWTPGAAYIPQTTEGAQREAALDFLAFIASPAGCAAMTEAATPVGPYVVEGCELPADVPPAVEDIRAYLEKGAASPALEFLSPVKGPNLENLTVEVGSGIRSAEDAAALYDQDVAQQAQQLGLEGW